jgi:MFS transporter, DHA1 family, staphyloferrin B biosynthesis exporter
MAVSGRIRWWLVLSVQFTTVATPLAMLPFLSIYLEQLSGADAHNVAIWAAVVATAPAICAVLSTPVWAYFAASQPIGRLLCLSCLLNALSALLQAQAVSIELFVLARSLQGLTGMGILLLLVVDYGQKSAGLAYSGLHQALAAGCIAGPLLGGFAFDHNSLPALLLVFSLIMALLGIGCGFSFRNIPPASNEKREHQPLPHSPTIGTRKLFLSGALATAGAFGFMPFFAGWAMERNPAVFTASLVGLIHAGSWAAAILVLPSWGKKAEAGGEMTAMRLSATGSVIALLLLLASSSVLLISLSRVLHGAFHSGFPPSFFSRLGRSEQRRSHLAIGRTTNTLGQITGPAICGITASVAGNDGALMAAALLTFAGAILLYFSTGEPVS